MLSCEKLESESVGVGTTSFCEFCGTTSLSFISADGFSVPVVCEADSVLDVETGLYDLVRVWRRLRASVDNWTPRSDGSAAGALNPLSSLRSGSTGVISCGVAPGISGNRVTISLQSVE